MKNIINEINRLIKLPYKTPRCFSDDNFLYCFCGKCKPKEYELPEDLKKIIGIDVARNYNDLIKKDGTSN